MPSRHRDLLVARCEGRLTITRHPDGCLLLYPRTQWEEKRSELALLPYSARALQRLVLGSAIDVELDSAGRLLVPGVLREEAHLGREATLLGLGEHFEVWDPDGLHAREQRDLAEGLPPAAAGFTF
jgi:MraZ protein